MKNKIASLSLFSLLAFSGMASATVTVVEKNFTSASVGIPIVNAAGVPAALNTVYASAGIFTTVPNFSTATAAQIVAAFAPIDSTAATTGAGPTAGSYAGSTPISNTTYTGLFTATDYSAANYWNGTSVGADIYILVGNNADLSLATQVAVYKGGTFQALVAGNAANTVNATTLGSWVYGVPTAVSTQTTVPGSAFTQGIQLTAVAVPEPSAALLGAFGALALLRRRR
ncbi:MAG: PEP-CTERM sorting domain-containing protein [Luteolibacter sp.]